MKKLLLLLTLGITLITLGACSKNTAYAAKQRALEEFYEDWEDHYYTYDIHKKDGFYIVTVYGEYFKATYIYKDGEIWCYENGGNYERS